MTSLVTLENKKLENIAEYKNTFRTPAYVLLCTSVWLNVCAVGMMVMHNKRDAKINNMW